MVCHKNASCSIMRNLVGDESREFFLPVVSVSLCRFRRSQNSPSPPSMTEEWSVPQRSFLPTVSVPFKVRKEFECCLFRRESFSLCKGFPGCFQKFHKCTTNVISEHRVGDIFYSRRWFSIRGVFVEQLPIS